MNESFEDKIFRVHQRLLEFAKTLNLDFVNIDTDTECVASGHVSLRIRVNKSQEQLVAEKLMEKPEQFPKRGGYVIPGVRVVEYPLKEYLSQKEDSAYEKSSP